MLLELIKWSIENRLNLFDFTVGEEHYKKDWCDSEIKLYEMVKPMTIKGNIFWLSKKIIQGVKIKLTDENIIVNTDLDKSEEIFKKNTGFSVPLDNSFCVEFGILWSSAIDL